MRIIGITGGVGAGKSKVLDYLEDKYHARILKADQLANDLKLPGGICYQSLNMVIKRGIPFRYTLQFIIKVNYNFP